MAGLFTPERRRTVARWLRDTDVSGISAEDMDNGEGRSLLLGLVAEEITDYRNGMHYAPYYFDAGPFVENLADLIDWPTCRIGYVPGSADRSCSACGVTFSTGTYQGGDHEEHEFMFCPNCGAEVVE